MQSSIKAFFQRKDPGQGDAVPPLKPSEHAAASEKPSSSSETAIAPQKSNSKENRVEIIISDTECELPPKSKWPAVQKKRRLTADSMANSKQFEQPPKPSPELTEPDCSEDEVTAYASKYENALGRLLHRRTVDDLKKMLLETLVLSSGRNQLWTKQFAHQRCVNQDVDDLICSWMRTFIRRRPLDINDDEVALLENYRVRSTAEQQRDHLFIVDDSDDDEIPLCRVLVLKGPVGSGKTSTVHSCLYALNEDKSGVIEVNTSQRRRHADLVNRFKEATQSQWIGENISAKPKPKSERTQKDAKGKRKCRPAKLVPDKHAVILIDDVDIAVEDDAGFSKGVAFLLKDTRRPIVLTCADLPRNIQQLLSNGYYNFNLLDQNHNSMITFLLSVAISQGAVALPSDADLLKCIHLFDRDLRSVINNLQFWLDADRAQLIRSVKNSRELSCIKASRVCLYPRFAGFSNFHFEAFSTNRRCQNRQSIVRHGIESELCNVIHENYVMLSCENDEDPRDIQSAIDLANVAEGLSLADLVSSYRDQRKEFPIHSRVISLSSGLIFEYSEGFICQSSRNMDISECILSSVRWNSSGSQIASIWSEHFVSDPLRKHFPSCLSFAVDHMSAIRSIFSQQTRSKLRSVRSTRRYQQYLRHTFTTKGIELLEKYCSSVNMEV